MSWRGRTHSLQRLLIAAGADPHFTVVEELPVASYVVLTAVPTAVVAAFILNARRSSGAVFPVVLGVAVVVALTLHWTRAAVVLAGDNWVARHTVFRWRFVRLDRLRVVDSYVSTAAGNWVWLRLRDAEGRRVTLNARSTVPRIRPLLASYVGQARAAGVPVEERAAQLLGLG